MEVPSILDQIQWFEHFSGMTAEEQEEKDQARQHEDVIVRQIQLTNDVINGNLGFGLPPGTDDEAVKDNIHGAWVRYQFDTADNPETITHNLGLPLADGSTSAVTFIPNVRWIVFMMSHDGTGANAASTLSVSHEVGDTITENSIQLRLYVGGGRTVDSDHKVTVDFFFIPAEQ
jgi:hypothetical protein